MRLKYGFKILELVAQFILNIFSKDVQANTNEIGNFFDLDKTILELATLKLQNDIVYNKLSKNYESMHLLKNIQIYKTLLSALRITSYFGLTLLCESKFKKSRAGA